MSDGASAVRPPAEWTGPPWRLWVRQIGILVRHELRRSLFTRRRFWVFLLAFVPLLLFGVPWVVHSRQPVDAAALENQTQIFAGIMQLYYVRLGLFFACMGVFTWLFRGEMVERTLHYPFLTPVRREVLVIGKFLAGAAIVISVFEISVLGSFFLLYGRFGKLGSAYVFDGPGLGQLGVYLLIIALGALGYGAVFLGLSLVFRNPIVPGALFLGWETITPVLPGWLQMLSVTFYLKHLYPVSVPSNSFLLGLFTVSTGPISSAVAVAGLLGFTVAVLAFSCYRIRRTEITYSVD
jgi:ABC-type transport system involved in multi-copper enzyme maturation permease subunit